MQLDKSMTSIEDCGFNFDTTYTTLPSQFFTEITPNPVELPEVIVVNTALANSIGLDFSSLNIKQQAALFSGNQLPKEVTPFSQAYAGHQFGHFSILGDGRAYVWGEHITSDGKRVDIQFKGSGRNAYSRRGDGKATLGPMLREYMISEAMYHLGIATTRSLAVITTGESVMRETMLPGAILTRVASSHIRVGTFEFAAEKLDKPAIEALMNYTIKRHYPELLDHQNKALALLQAVMQKQIELIVHWMRVGFIHGVMNTDNMAVSGETIDYGPCAFMDIYDPNTVFSSIDYMGRYAYANQPKIAQWNLAKFAQTLLPLIDNDMNNAISLAEHILNQFPAIYQQKWLMMMRTKLGLFGSYKQDQQLISELLDWMQKNHTDYTNTFRELSHASRPTGRCYEQKSFQAWYLRWQARLRKNTKSLKASLRLMKNNNPAVIPRNHKVEQALQAAHSGDFKPFKHLLAVFEKPYQDKASLKPYQDLPEPNERVYQTFCGT